MIIKKMALPRRTFLRGMGATLALPLLDAMFPALTSTAMAASNSVRRLGFVYIPMGMSPVEWTPQGEGRLTALSPSLSSLNAVSGPGDGHYQYRTEGHGLSDG